VACTQCGDLSDDIAAGHRDNLISATGFATAGAMGALAVVFLILGDQGRTARTGAIEWTPAVGPGDASIVGRF
jgi:hypothetical protein